MDSWYREIHVPQAWHVYLATGFENSCACFRSIGARLCYQPPTLPFYCEGKVMKTIFSPKLLVCIKDNNNSPHGKFH